VIIKVKESKFPRGEKELSCLLLKDSTPTVQPRRREREWQFPLMAKEEEKFSFSALSPAVA